MENNPIPVCQNHCVPALSEGRVRIRSNSMAGWLKLCIKRNLSGPVKRKLKQQLNALFQKFQFGKHKQETIEQPGVVKFFAGEIVRVKSEPEIRATLNFWKELKGCMFMDGQIRYCGTVQRILKPVERFVDERDYQVKEAKNIYLLEGAICEGTPTYGRCDRSCFYFWRAEWLERIEPA